MTDETDVDGPAEALKRARAQVSDLLGKLWNAPNTAIGLAYGGLGYGLGKLMGKNPKIRWGRNSIDFVNNPLTFSGITLGNSTSYYNDPYDPATPWIDGGYPVQDHERQHTYQGQLLGPLYLPSNLLDGVNALIHGQDWHGAANWNETGPGMDPPRPWRGRPR